MMHNTARSSATAAESRALEITGPQPVWTTLNEARERAFTGEIVFELDPEVFAYFDNGVVYYAERAGEAPLGQLLLDGGVLDEAQLASGMVRVGDVAHLGRLFEREPSVDRDAVVVLTELVTQELITDLANREIASVRVTAYRHHPSGVHRWFLDPVEAASGSVHHTGQLSAIPVGSGEDLSDELRIEWDEPLGAFDDDTRSVFADLDARLESLAEADPVTPLELDTETAADADDSHTELDAHVTDIETAADADDMMVSDEADGATVDDDDEFHVVWPDGSATGFADTVVENGEESGAESGADSDGSDPDEDPLPVVHEDEGGFRFEMPPLNFDPVSDDAATDLAGDVADEPVPDDVADAVRRALAAIETATAESASVAPMEDAITAAPVDTADPATAEPDLETELETADETAAGAVVVDGNRPAEEPAEQTHDEPAVREPAVHEPAVQPVVELVVEQPASDGPAAPASASPFAPPTPDMAAEAIYSREAAAAQAMSAVTTPESARAGVASAVDHIDNPDDDNSGGDNSGDGERTSALKRLIGSLRRKDR